MKKILLLLICVFYLSKINAQNCSFTVMPVSGTDTICNGSSVTFFASGSSGYYTWTIDSVWAAGSSGGPGGYVWAAPMVVGTSSFVTLSPTVTTKYNVTDTSGGCNTVQTIVVIVKPNPTVSINTTSVVCAYGYVNVIASGAQSYSWSPSPSSASANGDTVTYHNNGAATATYTVTGTAVNSCGTSATTTITTDFGPNFYTVAYTACANVAHSYVVLYGAQSYTCASCYYAPFGVVLVGGDTLLNNLTTTGTYTLFVADVNGCTAGYEGAITVNPMPVFTASSATVCNGQTVNLSASDSSLQYTWTNQAGTYTSNLQNPSILNANSSVAGNYFVTGTGANGCYNTDTVSVIVTPPVSVSYVMHKDTTLPNTWDAYPTYSPFVTTAIWYWDDGTSTVGLYPSHTYATAGTYNIWVTAFSSCGDSGSYFQNVSIYRLASNTVNGSNYVYVNVKHGTPTDIASIVTDNAITIYPNPVETNFTLALDKYSPTTHLLIYNALGQMVTNQVINALNTTINLNFAAGVYQAILIDDGKILNQTKLIKQ